MKNLSILFCTVFIFACSLSFTACSGGSDGEETGIEYTSAYICPMHCEGSGSDKAGKCPVCKMDYVTNENFKHDGNNGHEGHNHEGHSHEGHDHSGHDHDGHEH